MTSGYPWGWAPDGPTEHFGQRLVGSGTPHSWRYTRPLLRAMWSYLSTLEWPVGQPLTVTYLELAMDFEVATGMDLPAAKRHREGSLTSAADRAEAFASMLHHLGHHLSPHLVHGGELIQRGFSLSPLGVPRSAGLSRRPIFAGGAETERLLHQLETLSTRRLGRHPTAAKGHPRWSCWGQSFVPQHLPNRVNRTAEWSRKDGQPVAHEMAPLQERIHGGIAPSGAEKRPKLGIKLIPVCVPHCRPLCAVCRTKGSGTKPLLRCCSVHHTTPSQTTDGGLLCNPPQDFLR